MNHVMKYEPTYVVWPIVAIHECNDYFGQDHKKTMVR